MDTVKYKGRWVPGAKLQPGASAVERGTEELLVWHTMRIAIEISNDLELHPDSFLSKFICRYLIKNIEKRIIKMHQNNHSSVSFVLAKMLIFYLVSDAIPVAKHFESEKFPLN